MTFLPYSKQERIQVGRMKNLLNIYVNRESKIQNYSQDFPTIDPIARADEIASKASTLSDKQFHYAWANLFLSMRDLHTLYFMPAPHNCFTFYQPISFQIINQPGSGLNAQGAQKSTLVISGFSSKEGLYKISKPFLGPAAIGDTLLTVDGMGFGDYVKKSLFSFGGV